MFVLRPFIALLLLLSPVLAQDGSEFIVRLNRLEGQLRQLSGQVEQLGHENRQLKDQLRKFQEDTEYRLQEKAGGGTRRSPTPGAAPNNPERPVRRSDAFEPDTDPAAPGAPRALGSTAATSTPVGSEAVRGERSARGMIDEPPADRRSAPLDLAAAGGRGDALRGDGGAGRGSPVEPPAPPRAGSVASTGTGDARSDYDIAYAYLIQRQFDQAEMSFRSFIQSHPRDRLVSDATFWLGESYLLRNRPREAAEQFLRVSTEYSRSAKAPDAMLKLGVSLNALGAKDQACATFAELERKYPAASNSVRQGVDREQKRARCLT